MENETVLAKMKSNIEISNKEENLIINFQKSTRTWSKKLYAGNLSWIYVFQMEKNKRFR